MATSAHTRRRAAQSRPSRRSTRSISRPSSSGSRSAFVALYLIIAKLAIPQIGGIIAARGKRVADDIAEANALKEQSDAALAAYEKALADARTRAQALANETRDKLNAEAEKVRKVLEGNLDAKLADAEKTIAATKTSAMANIEAVATDTAIAIVERLIGTAPSRPGGAGARSLKC